MKTLAIDSSNQSLAVAIGTTDYVIANYLSTTDRNHSKNLLPVIDNLMQANQLTPKDLDRIVVAQGPGSYTGLRIGVTTAKTLASTLKIELVGVSSLAVLASNAREFTGYIVPVFDARRKNVYTGVYNWHENKLEMVKKERHVALVEWLVELQEVPEDLLFLGTDVGKMADLIREYLPEAKIADDSYLNSLNATNLLVLGEQTKPVTDIADFVPTYLKLVEAEEKWLETHSTKEQSYVEKI